VVASRDSAGLGIFLYSRFVPCRRFSRLVVASEWTTGGAGLTQIRNWVSINLALGVLVSLVTLLRGTT